jgi:hypothetical protein
MLALVPFTDVRLLAFGAIGPPSGSSGHSSDGLLTPWLKYNKIWPS